MTPRRQLKAIKAEAARLGLSVALVREHKHFVLSVGDGAERRTLVAGKTPNNRGEINTRATLRRLARQLQL